MLFKIENDDEVVIDCGANLDLFSACVASRSGHRVYAFEPVEKALFYLRKTTELYHDRICIVKKALSDETGYVTMSSRTDILGQNRIVEGTTGERVESVTLDDFVQSENLSRVDFIKADIEGAERLMLAGAKRTLKEFGPKISICEYHLDDDPIVLEGLIKEANPNYVVKHCYKKIYAWIP